MPTTVEPEPPKDPTKSPELQTTPASPTAILATKLNSLRARTSQYVENAPALINNLTVTPPEPDSEIKTSPQNLQDLLEDLQKIPPGSAAEYLARSSIALQCILQLKAQTAQEKSAIEREYQRLTENAQEVAAQHQEVDQIRGLRRFFTRRKRKELSAQKDSLDAQAAEAASQLEQKQKAINGIEGNQNELTQKREATILEEIKQEFSAISEGYKEMADEIITDGTLPADFAKTYILKVILPKLRKIPKEHPFIWADQRKYYTVLRDYITSPTKQNKAGQTPVDRLKKLLEADIDDAGSFTIADFKISCQPLLEDMNKTLVAELLNNMAVRDIYLLSSAIETHLTEGSGNFHQGLLKYIKISNLRHNRTYGSNSGFIGHIKFWEEIYSEIRYPSSSKMAFWQAAKTSEAAAQVLGDAVSEQDNLFYSLALKDSLKDDQGHVVYFIAEYPHPSTIRNLVLIAAAANTSHGVDAAIGALNLLNKKPDWSSILDQAETVYPSLKSAREVLTRKIPEGLQQWGIRSKFREAATNLALSIINEPGVDPALKEMATDSLTITPLLGLLEENGVITEAESKVFEQAAKISGAYFLNSLREKLLLCFKSVSGQLERPAHTVGWSDAGHMIDEWGPSLEQCRLEKEAAEAKNIIQNRFYKLAQKIIQNQHNKGVIIYLTDGKLISRIGESSFDANLLEPLLTAWQICPALTTDLSLLHQLLYQFQGEQTSHFFQDMVVSYRDFDKTIIFKMLNLVDRGKLTKARALELSSKAGPVFKNPNFSLAESYPEIFLETDEGLEIFTEAEEKGFFNLNLTQDAELGKSLGRLGKIDKRMLKNFCQATLFKQQESLKQMLDQETVTINGQNWMPLLMAYIEIMNNPYHHLLSNTAQKEKLIALFGEPKTRDFCLNQFRSIWEKYLKSGGVEIMPFSLLAVPGIISLYGDAGPLSQLESLSNFILSLHDSFARDTTAQRTKSEVFHGIYIMEEKFAKEKWSNEDRTDFYNISRDILIAAPSLFSDYLAVLQS